MQSLSANVMSRMGKEQQKVIHKEIEENISRMDAVRERVIKRYPKAYRHAVTHIAIRILLSDEKRKVERFGQQGVLTEEEVSALEHTLDVRRGQLSGFTHSTFYLTLKKLFS